MTESHPGGAIHELLNSTTLVETPAGGVLVNCPPETLKSILASGLRPPRFILLPPDVEPGKQLGSSGFVHQGVNFASVEFLLYANYFAGGGEKTHILTPTQQQAQRLRTILVETIVGPEHIEDYLEHPWLKQECAAVGTYPPLGRLPGPDDMAVIRSLDETGGSAELGAGVTVRLAADAYIILQDGAELARVSTAVREAPHPLSLAPARPLLRHELTVQFIGGSHGFDTEGITTCFLAYLGGSVETRPTLFDTAAYLNIRLANLGLSTRQISEVVLSHLHEDHLAGLPELLLMGDHRVRLLTSDIVCSGLLRVLSAMLDLPAFQVSSLFEFVPLNPGRPVTLDGRRFESIYAVHSIPTLAVRAEKLYFSGDMRYDETWFDEMVATGVLTKQRRQDLVHFADQAEILVQDAGGGTIHTTITPEVLEALAAKGQRVILAHTSDTNMSVADTFAGQVEIASSGHISRMGAEIPGSASEQVTRVETLSACPIFARLPIEDRMWVAEKATLHMWRDGDEIMHEGEASDKRAYVVHNGLIEIVIQDQLVRVLGRGSSVGERGALLGRVRTSSVRARGEAQMLGIDADVFGPIARMLGLKGAFHRADQLGELPMFAALQWATLLDLALEVRPRHVRAGETLFRYGEPGYEFYLLMSGTIRIEDRDGAFVDEMSNPGEFFGGRAALFNTLRNATGRAVTELEVWSLPAPALQRLQMVYPHLLLHLHVTESGRHGRAE
ncbi:MAG: cyclic nucleotide-binding domain-containing protein [Anaerolineales bacterium]